jgi:integrase
LKFRTKRAITAEEHALILAAEKNGERNLYYRMVWETGASQSDAALLSAANINHQNRTLCYNRMKTGELAQVSIGEKLASLISQLPETGPFFPTISRTSDNARSAEFYRRCKILKIKGISLHSYRYAWAERARAAGYAKEQIRRKSLSRSVVANEKALKISSHLYDSGLTDFLHVLVSERSLYVSQDTQVQSDQSVSLNLVQLYKALGGGWQIPSK